MSDPKKTVVLRVDMELVTRKLGLERNLFVLLRSTHVFACQASLVTCLLTEADCPSHGSESRVCSSAQYCLTDAARLMIVASSSTCQYVQSAGSVGTLIQCVRIDTVPSPLMKSKPHLMIPYSRITTGNTSANMYSTFQRWSVGDTNE